MDLALILSEKYSDFEWSIDGTDYSGLIWLSESPKPTEKELKALWNEVQYVTKLKAAKHSRHAAYTAPGGSDAILAKYLRDEATKQEWLDAVQAINDANPYPVKEGK